MNHRTYIELPKGDRFDFLAIDDGAFDLAEIAEALSHICRFTGHIPGRIYSVSHHSILVSRLVEPHLQLQALWHDAHEAYVGDVSTPLKDAIGVVAREFGCLTNPYREIEDKVAAAMRKLVELPADLHRAVKAADRLAYEIERDFFYRGEWHPALDDLLSMPVEDAGREWFLAVSDLLGRRGVTV